METKETKYSNGTTVIIVHDNYDEDDSSGASSAAWVCIVLIIVIVIGCLILCRCIKDETDDSFRRMKTEGIKREQARHKLISLQNTKTDQGLDDDDGFVNIDAMPAAQYSNGMRRVVYDQNQQILGSENAKPKKKSKIKAFFTGSK